MCYAKRNIYNKRQLNRFFCITNPNEKYNKQHSYKNSKSVLLYDVCKKFLNILRIFTNKAKIFLVKLKIEKKNAKMKFKPKNCM